MNRWGALKMLARLLGYMALVVGGWGFFVWAAFLIRFEFGLVMAGISLLAIAWAVNKSVEDKFSRAAEMYADTVFPPDPLSKPLGFPDSLPEETEDVIRHETTDNGDGGDDMEVQEVIVHPDVELRPTDWEEPDKLEGFELVKDEAVMDDVDQEIDRLLRGGK